jgi:hypothetical protein
VDVGELLFIQRSPWMDDPQQLVMQEWLGQMSVIVALIAGHGISTPVTAGHTWIFDLAGRRWAIREVKCI